MPLHFEIIRLWLVEAVNSSDMLVARLFFVKSSNYDLSTAFDEVRVEQLGQVQVADFDKADIYK